MPSAERAPSAPDRPNIVFVFADDWGWGDLGCYGHPYVRTPHLDALAAEGLRFTQFYVCSGVCSPSRAAVLTGRFPAHWGIHGHFATRAHNAERGMPNWLDPAAVTYTRLLQSAGYAVGHFGKWHLGHGDGAPPPADYGIDVSRVTTGNGPRFDWHDVYGDRVPFFPRTGLDTLAGPRSRSSERIVDETLAFIEARRDGPFLVNVWLNDTHATLDPDETQLEPYRHLMPVGVEHKHVGAKAIYAATVTEADRQVGRLVARLDELGLGENTVVIFSADNGPEDIVIGNASHSGVGSPGPFRGRKRSLYEGGVRTPFIVRWPGRAPAGRVDDDTPLCGVDLLPTFCALVGADVPAAAACQGEDMTEALCGRPRGRTTPLFWEWRFHVVGHVLNRSPALAVRRDNWKLLVNPDGSRAELYDVPSDPTELANRAAAEPGVVRRLRDEVMAWHETLPEGPWADGAGSNAYPWPRASA